MVFQAVQTKFGNRLPGQCQFFFLRQFFAYAGSDIFFHGHIVKQRIVLKQQSNPALLRRQIDVPFRVKKGHAIHSDATPVGTHNTGDAAQRHAFAAAAAAQNGQYFISAGKRYVQLEGTEILLNGCFDRHVYFPFVLLPAVDIFHPHA